MIFKTRVGHEWHQWWAWYPVRISDSTIAWLQTVSKRLKEPKTDDPWDIHYEYLKLIKGKINE